MTRGNVENFGDKNYSITSRAKTHCINNHEFTPKNIRYSVGGHRHCKACDVRYELNRKPRLRYIKMGEKVEAVVDPYKKGMEVPQGCKKCRTTGVYNFFHDLTDSMESFRCRQCGTEHYAYDAPPKSSKPGGKYSS